MQWRQDDENVKLADVLEQVDAEGPQTIVRGERRYVVSTEEAQVEAARPADDFVNFLINVGPRFDDDLVLPERRKTPPREIDL